MKKIFTFCLIVMVATSLFASTYSCARDFDDDGDIDTMIFGDTKGDVVVNGLGNIAIADCAFGIQDDKAVFSPYHWNDDVINYKDASVMLESGDTAITLKFNKAYKDKGLVLTRVNHTKLVSFLLNYPDCEALVIVTDTDDNILAFRFYIDAEDLPDMILKLQ